MVSMQRNTKAKGSLGVGYLHVRVVKRNQTKLQFFFTLTISVRKIDMSRMERG